MYRPRGQSQQDFRAAEAREVRSEPAQAVACGLGRDAEQAEFFSRGGRTGQKLDAAILQAEGTGQQFRDGRIGLALFCRSGRGDLQAVAERA